jgi:hypothetical protein
MTIFGWQSASDEVLEGIASVPQGAAATLWAAVTALADQVGGRYCEDCAVAKVSAKGSGVRAYSIDPERAKLLWAKSEMLVGIHHG